MEVDIQKLAAPHIWKVKDSKMSLMFLFGTPEKVKLCFQTEILGLLAIKLRALDETVYLCDYGSQVVFHLYLTAEPQWTQHVYIKERLKLKCDFIFNVTDELMSLWPVMSVNTGEHIVIWCHFDGCVWTLDTPASLCLSALTLEQVAVLLVSSAGFWLPLTLFPSSCSEELEHSMKKRLWRGSKMRAGTLLSLFSQCLVCFLSLCLSVSLFIFWSKQGPLCLSVPTALWAYL